MPPLLCLIDYDNARSVTDYDISDMDQNISLIISAVSNLVTSHFPGQDEIHLRLYGGWLNDRGQYTRNAQWLLTILPRVRGRHKHLLILPDLALALAAYPRYQIMGTFRKRNNKPSQKMVDTMIVLDALHYSKQSSDGLVVWSDDDDIAPAMLVASQLATNGTKLMLGRRRLCGEGVNDNFLQQIGIFLERIQS